MDSVPLGTESLFYLEKETTLFLLFVRVGSHSLVTDSAVTVTLAMLPSEGTEYIVFIRIFSRIPLKPLAPVF